MDAIQLIAWRMLLGSLGLAAIALAAGQSPLRLPPRRLAGLFAMGLLGYSFQAYTFLGALQTLPASLVELVLYTYPALVAIASWLLFRHRVPRVHVVALVASFAGVALLLGGIRPAGGTAVGVALMVACPVLFTGYLLAGERLTPGAPPLAASTLTTGGAAVTLLAIAIATGHFRPPGNAAAWAATAAVAVIPTMFAITALLAALPAVGAPRAALLSSVEPLITVALAVALLGDRFSPLQLVGGVLVIAAVVVLQWPRAVDSGA
jgi:drug/metabolite transporter (DMT)-like permease